ncbi:MAG: hypothetical protein AB7N65_19310 [Vicinamibacterales bacterium]
MCKRVAFVLLFGLFLLGVGNAPAAAQPPTSSEIYDLNVGVAYDLVLNEWNEASNVGLHFDVAKRFIEGNNMSVAGVGEIGFNHFENFTLSNYLGGVRFSGNYSRRFSPFAQFLLGAEHCCDTTDFAIQPGVGIDFPWSTRFAIRGQVDWRHVYTDLDDADGLRIGVGVVIPLNR